MSPDVSNVPAVRLEPMTWDDYDAWAPRSAAGFAAQQVAAGLTTEPAATAYAQGQQAVLLPDGLATPGQHLWTVRSEPDDVVVGWVWVGTAPAPEGAGGTAAYLYDIEVDTPARGQGFGRAALLATEAAARELGAGMLRLNVFGHNRPAIGLYESLGYAVEQTFSAHPGEVTARLMVKQLPGR